MKIRNLYEADARKVVAIMPGGFHPFHPGHKSLYDWAVKTFGIQNVYVAATADVSTRPFPFDIKKKLAAMAGVPAERFIQVKSPFNMRSYVDILDDNTALVFVRSVKDKGEQPLPDQTKKNGEPGYLRTYTGKNLNTFDQMGYIAYGPTINFNFGGMQIKSASELRAKWPEMSDEDKLKAAKLMYGNGAETAVQLLNKALGDTEAPVGEILGFATRTPKRTSIKKKPEKFEPTIRDKVAARRKAAASGDKNAWKSKKTLEKAPPGREKQVKKLKGKFDDPGAPYAIAWAQHNKHGKPKKKTNEGYKLQLERDTDMMVLNIVDTATGKRTEVRGKPGYETGNYDPNDKLHMLLDKIGKSADISQLMNGEPVGINPKHPQGASAKAATDKAYNENFAESDVPLGKYLYHVAYASGLTGMLRDGHLGEPDEYFSMTSDQKYIVSGNPEVQIVIDTAKVSKMETFEKYVDDWESTPGAGDWAKGDKGDFESEYRVEETIPWDYVVAVKILKSKATKEIIQLAKQRGVKLVGKDNNVTENFADGKKKGKSRPGRVKRSGASCNGSVTDLRKRAKKYGGERGRMYHWCANMKSGRKKS